MNTANHFSGMQVNTSFARDFRMIVTAGWGNLSDGHVEAPTGHFTVVEITEAELPELVEAVFSPETPVMATETYVGHFLVQEDSDGNTTLFSYETLELCMADFNMLQAEYSEWGTEGVPHTTVTRYYKSSE